MQETEYRCYDDNARSRVTPQGGTGAREKTQKGIYLTQSPPQGSQRIETGE